MKSHYEDLDEYIADLSATIERTPDCANHLYNLGVALLSKRDFHNAERSFLDSLRKSPRLAEAYVQLGGICLQRGDLDGCLNYNMEAANCRPRFAIAQGNIGYVHLQRGDAEKASEALTKAVKWDPNFVQAITSLAAAKYIWARWTKALPCPSAYLNCNPALVRPITTWPWPGWKRARAKRLWNTPSWPLSTVLTCRKTF
jgi:tetratricopeptide (TPR) repeat protein